MVALLSSYVMFPKVNNACGKATYLLSTLIGICYMSFVSELLLLMCLHMTGNILCLSVPVI